MTDKEREAALKELAFIVTQARLRGSGVSLPKEKSKAVANDKH